MTSSADDDVDWIKIKNTRAENTEFQSIGLSKHDDPISSSLSSSSCAEDDIKLKEVWTTMFI